ncbi:MAG: DNA gyrase subunit A, partial [Microgenomates bacterium OLB22]
MDDTRENTPVAITPGVAPIEISQEMRRSYLNYAMSVIVTRALPDIRDGLKPVHRRILYAMHKLGLHHTARFSKSAKVVGEVLGKYHPHGDVPVYDSLVRMAQTFSMRYPLILGQGNFGSIDGDSPAAMRYTEVKLTKISQELVSDIDKETVDWTDNFDATLKEPLFLPAAVPNLLLMGAEGIAVGMATRIPPHNLTEVVDAILYMIDNAKAPEPDQSSIFTYQAPRLYDLSFDPQLEGISPSEEEVPGQAVACAATLDDLMKFVTGPDFPTGAHIFGLEDIKQAYATGRGKIMVRGVMEEETIGKREAIIIKEIPYQTNKANLIAKIADLVRDKKIVGISDLRDESDKDGIRVVIELKKDAAYNKVLNNLFKHTELQSSYPVNMVALIGNIPQTVSLQTILEEYLKHRIEVVKRRSIFELKAAKRRAHILEGLLKALDHIDQIIDIIKKSRDENVAREQLMAQFGFSILQTQAILDMQLKRLTGLERGKLEEELKALQETINFLHGILTDVFLMLGEIKKQLLENQKSYTEMLEGLKVFKNRPGEISSEQLIEDKQVIVTLTNEGYIKTVPLDTFK